MLRNALIFWRDVTVLKRRYGRHNTSPALSTFTAHQTALPPTKLNDFNFGREIKQDASAEGISLVLVLQGLSLLHSL